MGNFIKDTAAKAAGNVTQSVASAVIVFLITTYVLVDTGKKESSENSPDIDTLKKGMNMSPVERQGSSMKRTLDPSSNIPQGEAKPQANTNNEQQTISNQFARGGVAKQATSEHEAVNVSLSSPGERKKEPLVSDAHAKEDSVAKEKKNADEIKKVKKRADDVFDELDEEVNKKPPQ